MTQGEAIKIMQSGANVFLTGAPGAGKTYTLNMFINYAEQKGKSLAITASTGIAASHIGGVTIHSWSGIGIADRLTPSDLDWHARNERLVKRYNTTNILIIDEISMLHGTRLSMVDQLARKLRKRDEPFGGMQVILVGDLFQLPPVSRDSSELDFAHHSDSWNDLDLSVCYITEQHRQEGDDPLLDILMAMRQDAITDKHRQLLLTKIAASIPKDITRLYSHNVDVDRINYQHLDALPGKTKTYEMVTEGNERRVETLTRNLLAPRKLELKVGAEVMFVANNFGAGFVNGTRGKVIKFKHGGPVVQTTEGRIIYVDWHDWQMKENNQVVASATQIPLRLAWAITIHKSQGMSLDAAEVDLSGAFTPGMGYVALSRVRSFDGLFLTGLNQQALVMHPEIYEFDALLREAK